MALFTYNETVRVKEHAPPECRPATLASVVMIHEGHGRTGEYFCRFPDGAVYTVEFEDGTSLEVHESFLEKSAFPGEKDAKS